MPAAAKNLSRQGMRAASSPSNAVLGGGTGTGKTHLAIAIAIARSWIRNEALEREADAGLLRCGWQASPPTEDEVAPNGAADATLKLTKTASDMQDAGWRDESLVRSQ
jgi:hypothetical protein